MPRPPILPTIDWKDIHARGLEFEEWLAQAENEEHREKMRAGVERQHVEITAQAMLEALGRDVYVVAFAEDWCGDVVRHVPVLEALRRSAPRLHVRYLSREQAPEAFARFLTNGGEAVPKFVFLSQDWVECGNWGPMPDDDREWISRGKACGDVKTAREKVSASYEMDKGRQKVVRELLGRIEIASAEQL